MEVVIVSVDAVCSLMGFKDLKLVNIDQAGYAILPAVVLARLGLCLTSAFCLIGSSGYGLFGGEGKLTPEAALISSSRCCCCCSFVLPFP